MELVKKAIKLARARRISQAELARMIGADPARLSEWKRGIGKPSIDHAVRMAKVLEVSLDYLADDEMKELPAVVTSDERSLIGTFRGSGLTLEQATERLWGDREQSAVHKPSQGEDHSHGKP